MVANEDPGDGAYRATPPQGLDLQVRTAAAGIEQPNTAPARATSAQVLEQEGISDAQLVEALRTFGFDTPLGEQTYTALMRYENAVFISWMNSGLIWEKVATLTYERIGRAYRGRSNWTTSEADDLRLETITQGLLEFETCVLEGWSPTRGASVKTYFTTRCLWIFLNEYKKFLRGKKAPVVLMGAIPLPRHEPDPQDVVVARDTARVALSRLSPEMQMILQYRAENYTNREIAELIGITEKAVEGRLRRYYDGKPWEGLSDE